MMKRMCMYKGVPIICSALTGELLLELTYRDPFFGQRADEFYKNQQQLNVATVPVDHHSPKAVEVTMHP
jgi:hypothetical protein